MSNRKRDDTTSGLLDKLLSILLKLPWAEALPELWTLARKLWESRVSRGMYEVLEYDSTLEIVDPAGTRARFRKREKVRYLQDNVIAYQDQAWGDGDILVDYRCTPGKPVDCYRSGHKRHVLISRREVKNRGDLDTFNIAWDVCNGFLKPTGYWEAHVMHRTRHLALTVLLPPLRPPKRVMLVETNRQRSARLNCTPLPDGRWSIDWETDSPRLHETYVLQWEW